MKLFESTRRILVAPVVAAWFLQTLPTNELKAATNDSAAAGKLFNNPIIAGRGACDPHVHIFGDRAYLFATHDEKRGNNFYAMYDWWVWSSPDLVNWSLEFTLKPEDMWVGPTKNCWATDGAGRNGKYYFYVSGNWHTGVAVSTNGPAGPYRDALGKALYTNYDPTVFVDDDANKTPYLLTGGFPYKIGRLNEDMISLAEEPRDLVHATKGWNGDGNWLHKHNGIYYLNGHGCDYSTATNVYGPYHYRGKFYTPWVDHPTVFTWHNQSYLAFGGGDRDQFYRKISMTYIHYKSNGDIVADAEVAKSFIGVGQYDCSKTIQAEWYFSASSDAVKEEGGTGFVMSNLRQGSYLYYPRILNVAANAGAKFSVAAKEGGGIIEVRQDATNGKLLGTVKVAATGSLANYQTVSTVLHCRTGILNLCLVFKGAGQIANLDWFTVASTGAIPVPPEVLPKFDPCTLPPAAEPISAFNQIEAENCLCHAGAMTEDCQDEGGGKSLAFIQNSANCAFKVDFGLPSDRSLEFQARVASGNPNGGSIEIRLDKGDGPLIGTCLVPDTGGWRAWRSIECKVGAVSGVHNVYLLFTGGEGYLLNINWFKFILSH